MVVLVVLSLAVAASAQYETMRGEAKRECWPPGRSEESQGIVAQYDTRTAGKACWYYWVWPTGLTDEGRRVGGEETPTRCSLPAATRAYEQSFTDVSIPVNSCHAQTDDNSNIRTGTGCTWYLVYLVPGINVCITTEDENIRNI